MFDCFKFRVYKINNNFLSDPAALTVRFLTKRFIGEYGNIGKFDNIV